jgi:hypothetical protein
VRCDITCFTSTKVRIMTLKPEARAAGNSRAVAAAAFARCVCITAFTGTKVQILTLKLEAQAAGNSRAVAAAAFALCVCTGDSAPARAAGFLENKKSVYLLYWDNRTNTPAAFALCVWRVSTEDMP